MDQDEVMNRIQRVFDDVFNDGVQARQDLSANEVEEWDSLTNAAILMAIESEFGVQVSPGEAQSLKNIGELVSLITRRAA